MTAGSIFCTRWRGECGVVRTRYVQGPMLKKSQAKNPYHASLGFSGWALIWCYFRLWPIRSQCLWLWLFTWLSLIVAFRVVCSWLWFLRCLCVPVCLVLQRLFSIIDPEVIISGCSCRDGYLRLWLLGWLLNFWLRFLGWLFLVEALGVVISCWCFLTRLVWPCVVVFCYALSLLTCLVVSFLAVYRLVLISPIVSCRVLSCPAVFPRSAVALGAVIFSGGSSCGNFWLRLLRWPFLNVAMGCIFWLATFPYFGLGFIWWWQRSSRLILRTRFWAYF